MKEGKERKSFWGCHALADLGIFWKHTFNLIIYVQRDVKLFNLKFFHLIGFKNVFFMERVKGWARVSFYSTC